MDCEASKSQDAPPIVPVSNTQHNFGRFGCLHARRNCLCIPPVLLIRKTARVWPFRGTDNLEVFAEGGQVPARGNRRPRQTFVFKAGERRLAIPRPFLERPEVSTAPKLIDPHARRHRLEKVQGGAAGHPQRRCRLFRRAARSAAARHAAGLHHRLGHPQPDPLGRAVRRMPRMAFRNNWPVLQGAARRQGRRCGSTS